MWVPLLDQLRSYDRATWWRDAVAGVVLCAVLVPAGMGYAEAAGLPAVHGLYATMVPLVVYGLFGPSQVLVVGPDSALAPLILVSITPLALGDGERFAVLAALLSVLAGGWCVLAAVGRFGFLADLISLPVRYGYLNGIAITVLIGQLPTLFGFDVDEDTVTGTARALVEGLADGRAVGWATVIGGGALAAILALRTWRPALPGTLLAIVAATVAVPLLGLGDGGLDLVGRLPRGLPSPSIPDVGWDDLVDLLVPALGVALVSFTDTSVLSRTFAFRRGERVDPNRELIALGVVNVGAGLFQGFPVSASATRTPVAEAAGARTQVTGLVGAVLVAVFVVAAPGAFANLPRTALAAVVIAAALRLIEVRRSAGLGRQQRSELVISVVTFVAVLGLGVLRGIGVAVALSLLDFLRRVWRPHVTELVRVDGVKGYHDALRHPEGRRVPGLLLFRFDASLFFANAATFASELLAAVQRAEQPVKRIVVTAEPITEIDATAADELVRLIHELDQRGIELGFAELKGHVRDRFEDYGVLAHLPPDRIYRTTGEAVKRYVRDHQVEWVDWEDA